jgi:sec-independent protein translocase protein TatA
MSPLVIGGLGTTELLIILAVLVLLFGATKLPELARGSGRALRIFKAETKGLMDDEDSVDSAMKTPEQLEIDKRHAAEQRAAELEAEAERLRRGETA